MSDLRQAAEQALEALRYTTDHLPAKTGVERHVDDAITALQVALSTEGGAKRPVKTYCGGKPNYVDEVDISEKCVDESDKSIHEPVAIVNSGMGGIEWLEAPLPDDTPLYAEPYTKPDTTGRVLHKEWVGPTDKRILSK